MEESQLYLLASKRKELGDEFQRLVTNYRKDPSIRKTPDYLKAKLEKLEQLWTTFNTNNTELELHARTYSHHPYLEKQYFAKVSVQYIKVKRNIQQLLHNLEASSPSGSAVSTEAKDDVQHFKTSNAPLEEMDSLTTKRIKNLIRRQSVIIQSIVHLINGIDSIEVGQPSQFYEVKLSTLHRFWDDARGLHQDICESADDVTALGYTPMPRPEASHSRAHYTGCS
ncbi:unnamed protein product [Hermetia illucens]|uniref:Uncharacterized protein n=1 Tax=Hermetia illucens TaxID=343691 RepID=A0A7R8Z290_HERIL|nr:unnamed protein product [Hermetia illucens]